MNASCPNSFRKLRFLLQSDKLCAAAIRQCILQYCQPFALVNCTDFWPSTGMLVLCATFMLAAFSSRFFGIRVITCLTFSYSLHIGSTVNYWVKPGSQYVMHSCATCTAQSCGVALVLRNSSFVFTILIRWKSLWLLLGHCHHLAFVATVGLFSTTT